MAADHEDLGFMTDFRLDTLQIPPPHLQDEQSDMMDVPSAYDVALIKGKAAGIKNSAQRFGRDLGMETSMGEGSSGMASGQAAPASASASNLDFLEGLGGSSSGGGEATDTTPDSATLDALLASLVASPPSETGALSHASNSAQPSYHAYHRQTQQQRQQHLQPANAEAALPSVLHTGSVVTSRSSSHSPSRMSRKRPLDAGAVPKPTPGQYSPLTEQASRLGRASSASSAPQAPKEASQEALQQALASLPPDMQESLLQALVLSVNRHAENPRSTAVPPPSSTMPSDQAVSFPSDFGLAPSSSMHYNQGVEHYSSQPPAQSMEPPQYVQSQQSWYRPMWDSAAHEQPTLSQPRSPVTAVASASYGSMRDPALLTPGVSPAMTPLSTFSATSFPASWPTDPTSLASSQALSLNLPQTLTANDLFSPLTSPALGPQGYSGSSAPSAPSEPVASVQGQRHHRSQSQNALQGVQPLIEQAAALGLSSPFPYHVLGGPALQGNPQGQAFTPEQLQLVRRFAMAEVSKAHAQATTTPLFQAMGAQHATSSAQQAFLNNASSGALQDPRDRLLATGGSSSGAEALAARVRKSSTTSTAGRGGRSARTPKTRPSPLVRPSDSLCKPRGGAKGKERDGSDPAEAGGLKLDEGGKGAKRARSNASGSSVSASASPAVPPACQPGGAQGTPLVCGTLAPGAAGNKDSPSPVDLEGALPPGAGPAGPFVPPVEHPPRAYAPSAMPPPSFPASLSGGAKRLAPVTPASIMNLGPDVNELGGRSPRTRARRSGSAVQTADMDLVLLAAVSGPEPAPGPTAAASLVDVAMQDRMHDRAKPSPKLRALGSELEGPADKGSATVHTDHPASKASGWDRGRPILPATAGLEALARISAKPHYLDGRGKDFVSTAAREAQMLEDEPPDQRRSSHKAAEQKRRDALRMCLDDMRRILPPIYWSEEDEAERRPGEGNVGGQKGAAFDPEHPNKGISKVALLRRANEYMLTLHERIKRRDGALELLSEALHRLRAALPPGAGAEEPAADAELRVAGEIMAALRQERVEDEVARRKALEQQQGDADSADEEEGGRGKAQKKKKGPAKAARASGDEAKTAPACRGRKKGGGT